ncbi:MAG: argininosuccinate synthase [Gemmatimonadota bacterium]
MKERVALAYSGGLDTSIIIPWLKENYDLEVHCVAGDVGQGEGELDGLEEKALATGAASCKVVDLRREFVEEYVWPCVRAMTVYEGRYLLGTSMARPVLAKAQVEYAREVGARYVAHGCTGRGNDQVRFELGYQTLAPDLKVIAPWREWDIRSRTQALDYAAAHGVPVTASREKIYSRDRNLWHISHEGGALEDPANAPPDDVWMLTAHPWEAPDSPEEVSLTFERGVPVAVDGKAMAAEALVADLNTRAGRHGVGRVDICENRMVGMKSRGVYETPGGTVILEAARTLRSLTLDKDTARLTERLMPEYADLVYTGRWFVPERRALDTLFRVASEPVTGEVRVRLFKGQATALAATSPYSLFREDLSTFEDSDTYDHADAGGFIRLYGLASKVAAERDRSAS